MKWEKYLWKVEQIKKRHDMRNFPGNFIFQLSFEYDKLERLRSIEMFTMNEFHDGKVFCSIKIS